jgi:hypothetical protein
LFVLNTRKVLFLLLKLCWKFNDSHFLVGVVSFYVLLTQGLSVLLWLKIFIIL